MAGEIELTDANFKKEILDHQGVAVVDFFATWCGPCKAFAPVFKDFAASAPEGVAVGRADVDQCPQAAVQNSIMSVPTVVFFKDGEALDRVIGPQRKADLLAKVKALQG